MQNISKFRMTWQTKQRGSNPLGVAIFRPNLNIGEHRGKRTCRRPPRLELLLILLLTRHSVNFLKVCVLTATAEFFQIQKQIFRFSNLSHHFVAIFCRCASVSEAFRECCKQRVRAFVLVGSCAHSARIAVRLRAASVSRVAQCGSGGCRDGPVNA